MNRFLMVLDHDTTVRLESRFVFLLLYEWFASRVFFLICDSRPALTCSAHRGKQQASVSSSVAQGEDALDFAISAR